MKTHNHIPALVYIARIYSRWKSLFTVVEIKRSDCATQLDFDLHYINERERVGLNYITASVIVGSMLGALFVAVGIAGMK